MNKDIVYRFSFFLLMLLSTFKDLYIAIDIGACSISFIVEKLVYWTWFRCFLQVLNLVCCLVTKQFHVVFWGFFILE